MKKKMSYQLHDGHFMIAVERERQKLVEKYDAKHDDKHKSGELAVAAACYAVNGTYVSVLDYHRHDAWPWERKFDKRGKQDRVRELVKAGALIAAEIDRLQRLKK